MADATIQSILLNGNEQVADEQGRVDLDFDVQVEDSEINEGFSITLGSETKTLATTGKIKVQADNKIDIEDSFQDTNAIVRSETLKQFANVQNSTIDIVNNAIGTFSSKANIQREGDGIVTGACFSIIDSECRKGLKTYGLLDALEEKEYYITLALTPSFIERGYGLEADSNRYDMLSVDDILELKDKGYSFCNNSWSQDRELFYSYKATEEELRADFDLVNQWFAHKGMKSCAFHYPFDTQENVKKALPYYENYAIGNLNGINGYNSPSYDLSVIPLTLENTSMIIEAVSKAVNNDGFIIFDLKNFGKSQEDIEKQKNVLNILLTLDTIYNIKYLPLPEALEHKAIKSFGDESKFFIQKNGVLRATVDQKTEMDIIGRMGFEMLSQEFKEALYSFCKSAVADTPATGIELLVDGISKESFGPLSYGKSYNLDYIFIPRYASRSTNSVTYILNDESGMVTLVENVLTIEPKRKHTVSYSDINGTGEDGLTIVSADEYGEVLSKPLTFKIVAFIAGLMTSFEQEFEFEVQ